MKKIFLMIFIIIMSYNMVFASTIELEYDGTIHTYDGPDVNLILNGEKFIPSENQMPPVIINDRTLVPVRETFEKLGGEVIWDAGDRKVTVNIEENSINLWLDKTIAVVNNKEIQLDVPAKLINSKTMVPLRFISENGGLKVDWEGTTSTVTVSKKSDDEVKIVNIKAVTLSRINDTDCVVIDLDGDTKYNDFSLQAEDLKPFRIILDVHNSKFDFNYDTITPDNSEVVSQIRFGVQEENVNRIVIDAKKEIDYTVIKNSDGTQIIIFFTSNYNPTEPVVEGINDNNASSNEKSDSNQENTNNENDNSNELNNNDTVLETTNTNENIIDNNVIEESNTKSEITSTITSLKYSTASEKVRILLDNKFEYELTELENPRRVVLEFKESDLKLEGPSEITLKNKAISSIVANKLDNGGSAITITLESNATYDISKKSTELQIKAEQPSYKNVEYTNNGSNAELILRNVDLSSLTKLQSKSTKKYTIKYSSLNFDPGSGAMEINDEYVKKINVTSSKITITDTGSIKYTAEQKGNDVVFTITKLDSNNERIIILDAGHGGNDPGAINGDAKEKTYNLKILLKLKDLLEDAGYTVYTTRESDVTLTVNERVYPATKDYPEASLYVSIHHNSLDNKNYSGTLVMYCNRDTSNYGVTNKQFATYVLNELVDNLGTINRGFIEVKENDTSKRVLTEVPMPSILCEVAFISNDEELTRIKTDKFQSQAAEAIFNGIQKTLSKMN